MKSTSHLFLRAARMALQWRLLVLWSALLLVPTLVLALPLWRILGGALDHSVHAAVLAQHLDALAAFDLVAVLKRESGALETGGVLSLLLTLALSPLLSGMAVTAVRAPAPPGFGALVTGALALYGRMARMLVWSAVPLGAALAIGGALVAWIGTRNDAATIETDAALLLFALAQATVDAGRAVLVLEPQRTSAVKAWWAGLRLVRRRPLASLGGWFAVALVGTVLAGVCAVVRIGVPPLGAGPIVVGLVLGQAAGLCLAWSRQARLFVLVALGRASAARTAFPIYPAATAERIPG